MTEPRKQGGPLTGPTAYGRRAILLGGLAAIAAPPSGWSAVPQATSTVSPGQLPAFQVRANAAIAASSPITLGHAFAKGDVPADSFQRLIVSTKGGRTAQVQVDQSNAWPDGSLRFAALSFKSPIAFTAGQAASLQLDIGSNVPGGSAITAAQLAAATNFQIKVKGHDYGSDTFTVSFNDVIADFPQWNKRTGWAANPLGGWELIRSGPLCTEWRVWRFLKRDRDGASHRWVKAVLYVRAWSDGQGGIMGCHVLPGMQQSNCYGPHHSGTVGNATTPLKHSGVAELFNGGSRVSSYGGPNDPNRVASVTTYPMRGWWGALGDGSVPWAGAGPAQSYMVAHDLPYLTRRTRMVPPYKLDLPVENYRGNDKYQVNVSMLPSAINATGDSNDDERVGYIHHTGACLLLNPLDRAREIRELAFGWSWADWEIWQTDERTGQPVNTTRAAAGPLPANPDYATKVGAHLGNPGWIGLGPENNVHGFDYGFLMDASHLPSLWIVPLLRTGHAAFQEMAVASACALTGSIDSAGRNVSANGVNYDNVFSFFWSNYNNVRAIGWSARTWGMADRMVPDAHPMRFYVKLVMDQNAAFAKVGPLNPDHEFDVLGLVYTNFENAGNANKDGSPHNFMLGIVGLGLGMEAWVNDRQGWQVLLNKLQPATIGVYDNDNGGDGYNLDVYGIWGTDASGKAYKSIAAQRAGNFPKDPGPHATGARYDGAGDAGRAYLPFAATLSRAGIAMQAWLDAPTPRAREVLAAIETRYSTPPLAGFRFSGSDGAFPVWAIAAPESQPRHRAAARAP